MILDFTVENYKSIKKQLSLPLIAARVVDNNNDITPIDEDHKYNTFKTPGGNEALKCVAIYGGNNSGKSNLIKSIIIFKNIVTSRTHEEMKEALNSVVPFMLDDTYESTFFQLIFEIESTDYRYGFKVHKGFITEEWLAETELDKEENILFNNEYETNELYLQKEKGKNDTFSKVIEYIRNITIINTNGDYSFYLDLKEALKSEKTAESISNFIKLTDPSIDSVCLVKKDNNTDVIVKRKVYGNEAEAKKIGFSLMHAESSGTMQVAILSPAIINAIKENRPIFIDNLSNNLHPRVFKTIVEMFNSKTNKSAQLVFTTHDSSLLDERILRRDQICFMDKNKNEESYLYSLVNFRLGNQEDYQKDYLLGKLGAINYTHSDPIDYLID